MCSVRAQDGCTRPVAEALTSVRPTDAAVVFRSLIVIWTASTGYVALNIALTPAPPGSSTVLLRVIDINVAVLILLVLGRNSLPMWTIDVCGFVLTAIVGVLVVTYRDASAPYAFFYLWL